jgi:hypothetical protein
MHQFEKERDLVRQNSLKIIFNPRILLFHFSQFCGLPEENKSGEKQIKNAKYPVRGVFSSKKFKEKVAIQFIRGNFQNALLFFFSLRRLKAI